MDKKTPRKETPRKKIVAPKSKAIRTRSNGHASEIVLWEIRSRVLDTTHHYFAFVNKDETPLFSATNGYQRLQGRYREVMLEEGPKFFGHIRGWRNNVRVRRLVPQDIARLPLEDKIPQAEVDKVREMINDLNTSKRRKRSDPDARDYHDRQHKASDFYEERPASIATLEKVLGYLRR
jgi:hypothetical protein